MIKIITTRMMKTMKRNERKKFIERFSFLFDIHHHTLCRPRRPRRIHLLLRGELH